MAAFLVFSGAVVAQEAVSWPAQGAPATERLPVSGGPVTPLTPLAQFASVEPVEAPVGAPVPTAGPAWVVAQAPAASVETTAPAAAPAAAVAPVPAPAAVPAPATVPAPAQASTPVAEPAGAVAPAPAQAAGAAPADGAPPATPPAAANPADPFEGFNRSMHSFNEGVDRAVLRPVATGYQKVVPSLVRQGVSNFFNNVGDVWNLVNNALQLKLQDSAETFMRLNVNTVFGLAGVLDVATDLGIERHPEDFGQTLGRWGVPSGPFVMLPLFGPSTVRDTAALPVDRYGNPIAAIQDIPVRNSLTALSVVDTRANLLRTSNLLEGASLDSYTFVRDAYLQKRRNDVADGEASGDGRLPRDDTGANDGRLPPEGQ